jgi:TATA-box binding protein (TBP) (component of TFIID and TFIIIB)
MDMPFPGFLQSIKIKMGSNHRDRSKYRLILLKITSSKLTLLKFKSSKHAKMSAIETRENTKLVVKLRDKLKMDCQLISESNPKPKIIHY